MATDSASDTLGFALPMFEKSPKVSQNLLSPKATGKYNSRLTSYCGSSQANLMSILPFKWG